MTGPTTAAELVDLVVAELHELQHRAGTPAAAPIGQHWAAAWPAFLRSAQRLTEALHNQSPVGGTAPPGVPTSGTAVPDENLRRAADYLGAAADLLDTRDRRSLSAQPCAADAEHVTPHLAAAGYLVAAVTAAHPALLDTAASVAIAVKAWQPAPQVDAPATTTILSLADASTVASPPRRSAVTDPPQADPGGSALAALHAALYGWRRTAAYVAPAPSQSDLYGAARTAGMLTRLSQNLLNAHAAAAGSGEAVAAVQEQLRRTGAAWNAAADVWRTTATGGRTLSLDLRDAGAALEAAVLVFARTGAGWTSPQDLRAKATPELALQLARTALTATQAVAEQHAPLVARLGHTGALYTPVRHLPVPQTAEEPEQRVIDRLAGRFAPMSVVDSGPPVAAYLRLRAAAAAARMTCTELTSPAARPAPTAVPAGARPAGRTVPPTAVGRQQTSEPDSAAEPVPVTLAGQRWQQTLAGVDPQLLFDPHNPALAAALDRVQLAGADVTASLAAAAAVRPLPAEHTARALHYQLVDVCPAAITPYTDATGPVRPPAQAVGLPAVAAHPAGRAAPTMRR